jgi:hypothetical protein
MSGLRCQPGDIAVVIHADFSANLGRVVRIIKRDNARGELSFDADIPTWEIESAQPLSWYVGQKRYRRKRGPVPDAYLQPIRGFPVPRDIADGLYEPENWREKRVASGFIEKLF